MSTNSIDLADLTDHPALVVAIAGDEYSFSELPLKALGELQAWLKLHVPNPIHALKGDVLDGLPAHVAAAMGEAARVAALSWPPDIGTASGIAALLSTEPGQREAIRVGLAVHRPGLADHQVRAVYKALRQDASREAKRAKLAGKSYDGEGKVKAIFAVLFGLEDSGDDDDPKA